MPYSYRSRYRRGYSSYSRSKYRRYRRTFSKYNTYRNRSSVAQANQIYRLNKRITKIESNTKPEYLEYKPTEITTRLTVGADNNAWTELTRLHITDGTVAANGTVTDFAAQIKDSSARQVKIIVWGTLERNPTSIDGDTHDIPFSCGYVRIAVVQYMAERYADASGFEFFTNTGGPSSFYSPLKKGCGTHGRILKIFNIKISSLDPTTKNFKFIIKPKYKIVRKTSTAGVVTPSQRMKGGIVLLPVGFVENNNEKNVSSYWLNLFAKVIYTDA